MDKSEQIWNILLHYSKPLTDDEDAAEVVMGDDLRSLHADLVTVFEGKEVIYQSRPEPKPKPKKEKLTKQEGAAAMEASMKPGQAVPVPELPPGAWSPGPPPEEKKKPWWKFGR